MRGSNLVLKPLVWWDRFWFSSVDPLPVALFRIALGLLWLLMLLLSGPNWHRFYALDGLISRVNLPVREVLPADDWWNVMSWTQGWISLDQWWWIGVLAASLLTVGLQARLAAIVIWALQTAMLHRDPLITNGDDLVFRMMLFWAMFCPLSHCLSVDAALRRGQGRADRKPPWIWPVRMLQINILAIYCSSLPYKFIQDDAWAQGQAIYWTMASDMWYCGFAPWISYRCSGAFTYLATYGTILIEGLFPVLVWFPQTRLWALLAIAGLHLGIAIMIPNVLFFTLAMEVGFVIFLPPNFVRKLYRKLRPGKS